MFFIPFFGAAVSGLETRPTGVRRAVVALSGPAPGIVLGIACTVLYHATHQEIWMNAARAFLYLNAFNLLPFIPLDGGRYFEAILFLRSPILRALSDLAAAVALGAVAYAGRSVVFGLLAFFVLQSVRHTYFSGRLAAQIKKELAQSDAEPHASRSLGADERIPFEYIERLVPLIEDRLPEPRRTPKGIAAELSRVWSMVRFTPPSIAASIVMILLYVASLGIGIVAAVGAEVSFRPRAAAESTDRQ
jgi:hypothetical protein